MVTPNIRRSKRRSKRGRKIKTGTQLVLCTCVPGDQIRCRDDVAGTALRVLRRESSRHLVQCSPRRHGFSTWILIRFSGPGRASLHRIHSPPVPLSPSPCRPPLSSLRLPLHVPCFPGALALSRPFGVRGEFRVYWTGSTGIDSTRATSGLSATPGLWPGGRGRRIGRARRFMRLMELPDGRRYAYSRRK